MLLAINVAALHRVIADAGPALSAEARERASLSRCRPLLGAIAEIVQITASEFSDSDSKSRRAPSEEREREREREPRGKPRNDVDRLAFRASVKKRATARMRMTHVTALFHVNISPLPPRREIPEPFRPAIASRSRRAARVEIASRRVAIETRRGSARALIGFPRKRARVGSAVEEESKSRGTPRRNARAFRFDAPGAHLCVRFSFRGRAETALAPRCSPSEKRHRTATVNPPPSHLHLLLRPPATYRRRVPIPRAIVSPAISSCSVTRAARCSARDRARSRIRIRDLHSYRSAAVSACN